MSPKRPSSASRSSQRPRRQSPSSKARSSQANSSSKKEKGPVPPTLPPALQQAIEQLGLDRSHLQQVERTLQGLIDQGILQVATAIDSHSPLLPSSESIESTGIETPVPATAKGSSERETPKNSSQTKKKDLKEKDSRKKDSQERDSHPRGPSIENPPKRKSPFPSEAKGILRKHPRGFGFVAPQDCPSIEEIFIPKQYTAGAMDGDLVEVEISPLSVHSPKGPEGQVIKVLERAREHLLGYVTGPTTAWVRGIEEFMGMVELRVPPGIEVNPQDRVLMRMESWPDAEQDQLGVGVVERVIGSLDDPSKDIECAIAEFGLSATFPVEVQKEAFAWGDRVTPRDLEGREDLREIECLTIDPTTAKDFDDALSIVKTSRGSYHLGVHIADVAYYVRSGSGLDREARKRCNSTYFPGRCVPMLPHELSDNLCSLKPEVNRLAVTVFMEFSPDGEMNRYRIARSVIRSAKRFTYEEALQVLEGKKRSKFKGSLDLMVELCALLKKKRAERGSVELALSDVQVVVGPDGVPTGLERHEYDITHQMVEEFMLKANEVVAAHLTKQGKPVAYRIHEAPSPADLKEFAATARALGYTLPMPATNADLQALFDSAKGSPHAPQLAVSFIKSMKLAYYSPDNIGHYGLGLEHYCHFTSPIRRYSDLIAQRALFGESETLLAEMTEACSEQERRSSRAEESVVRLKKLRMLSSWLDQEPLRAFPAIITRVKPNGISFELPDLMLEGFLHVRALGSDFYHFVERQMAFVGERTGQKFAYGQTISVQIDSMDLMSGEIEWQMTQSGDRRSGGSRRSPRRPRDEQEFEEDFPEDREEEENLDGESTPSRRSRKRSSRARKKRS